MYVKILNFFKAGSDQPPLVDENQINKKYSKYVQSFVEMNESGLI